MPGATRSHTVTSLLVVLLTAAAVAPVRAQSRPVYLQFDPYTVKGALYRPDSGDEPVVGVLVIHRVNNYLGHLAARELARRGFLVLAMNFNYVRDWMNARFAR